MSNELKLALTLAKFAPHRITQVERLIRVGIPASEAVQLVARARAAISGVR